MGYGEDDGHSAWFERGTRNQRKNTIRLGLIHKRCAASEEGRKNQLFRLFLLLCIKVFLTEVLVHFLLSMIQALLFRLWK